MRTPACPFAARGSYLQRTPEKLVVKGLRLWAAGYERGDLAFWQSAWNVYATTLGPVRARPAVTQLSHWVKAICLWRPERLRCFSADCPFMCQDECLAAGLIAACQHGDAACATYCAEGLGGPAGQREVIESAAGFADTLRGLGQLMLPVPKDVVRSLVEEPPSTSYH